MNRRPSPPMVQSLWDRADQATTSGRFAGLQPTEWLASATLRVELNSAWRSAPPTYVLELANALREIDAEDPHVFAVERLVKAAGA